MKKQMFSAKLSQYAKNILFWTLPIVLIQVMLFALFLASKSGYELAGSGEVITIMLEQIGKSLILSIFGSLVFDLIEKRNCDKI